MRRRPQVAGVFTCVPDRRGEGLVVAVVVVADHHVMHVMHVMTVPMAVHVAHHHAAVVLAGMHADRIFVGQGRGGRGGQ